MNDQKKNAVNEHWLERFSQHGPSLVREPLVGDVTRWTTYTSDGTEDSMFMLYDWSMLHPNDASMTFPVVDWITYEDSNPTSLEVHLLNGKHAQIATVIACDSYSDRAVLQFLLDGANAGNPIEMHNRENNPSEMQIITNHPGTLVNGFRITAHGIYTPIVGGVSFGAPEVSGSPHPHHLKARDDWRKKARLRSPKR
ncbi:hypothetical protein KR767_05460 [Luteibacter anthropi]|uniref:hypothetical protein n=1 Tax=Luteibacter anthropi TaxID=564369 RepID=UPI0020330850|nr:hypothetical protein [Luteibacter anthropi]URX63515.1 hypothetical protein KR767_05460 [Luteibacter anthropi]